MFKNIFKKKKSKMFGSNVEPSCSYCKFNSSKDDILCPYGKDSVCSHYQYDPLKRKPMRKAQIRKFSQDDFIL